MGLFTTKPSSSKDKVEINPRELKVRLKVLIKENNIEIIHLALQSILEELEEKIKESK